MSTGDGTRHYEARHLVIGGGVAGIVAALELLDGGGSVLLLDADTEERFGGLALWAFGGMALCGTPEQRRMGVHDSPETLLADWIRFGELEADDRWPLAWAKCYADESREQVYDWLKSLGLRFMPAVNFVERGEKVPGNSVPRYHILWGTGRELVQTVAGRLRRHPNASRLEIRHQHRASELDFEDGRVVGCRGIDASDGAPFVARAEHVVVATGGINGTVDNVRRHWPEGWAGPPAFFLNGAHPNSDGALHESAARHGARLAHLEDMWNYAAGIPHPRPHFEGHGLSLIPCKTGLWLDPDGAQLSPMVTGFDTREMCRQVAAHPYTWQVLNRRILLRELAISGAEHNPHILNHRMIRFLKDTLLGNTRLYRQMLDESPEFIAADSWDELAKRMNALSGEQRIDAARLRALAEDYDAAMADPARHAAHPQVSRILEVRKWRTDRLRTCKLQAIGERRAGPLIAIRLRFISRKSMGGLVTDLAGRVLAADGAPIPGLYAVGEAAGFGGGGASGKRSLEGTFLSGCILTARKAAAGILAAGAG